MNVTKEIVKKGEAGQFVADLEISQPAPMTIRVGSGPVFWRGEDHALVEHSDYVVDEDPVARWIGIHLAKRSSDGQCVVFMDEDYMGHPGFNFNDSAEYETLYKLGEVAVPAGATDLDDAPMFIRRWVVPEGADESGVTPDPEPEPDLPPPPDEE